MAKSEAKKDKKPEQSAIQPFHVEVLRQMLTLATSGFGLVAALAWNNVIQEFVNDYVKKWLPAGGGISSLFLYAILITCLAVFVTYQLSKLLSRFGIKK